MGKSELFYAVGECLDDAKYFKRKGLQPNKTVMKSLDGKPFPVVLEYTNGSDIYVSLAADKCYSGYVVTLMRLPELPFDELLHVALTATRIEDRAGSLGMILKNHEAAFEQYLLAIKQNEHLDAIHKKQIAVVTTFVCEFIQENTSYIRDMKKILSLCEELKSKYANVLPQSKWIRLFRYGI